MRSFPTEILYLILGSTENLDPWYYGKTESTLSRCSRVCRSWKPIAQDLLYRVLRVRLERHSLTQLYAFLRSTPFIAGLVRILHLFPNKARGYGGRYTNLTEVAIKPRLLVAILRCLPKLSELDLRQVIISGWPLSRALPSIPIKLRTLRMVEVSFKPNRSASGMPFDVLALFEVDEAELSMSADRGHPKHPRLILTHAGAPRPTIRKLNISRGECFSLLNHSLGGLNSTELRVLELNPPTFEAVKFAGRLIRHYGQHLSQLRLDICVTLENRLSTGPGTTSSIRAYQHIP